MNHNPRPFFLLTILLLILCACSNESSDNVFEQEADYQSEQLHGSEEGPYDDPATVNAYPQNWRPGTLFLTLKISQHGDQQTETKDQGGTKTEAKWDYLLTAMQQRQVMLPPDFTKIFPDYDADLIDAVLLEELLFIPMEQIDPVTEGEVSFSGQVETRTPQANEITMKTTLVEANTKLVDINLDAVRFSDIGKGFEADLRYTYKMDGNIRTTSHYRGGTIQTFDLECCDNEAEYPRFFPEPDRNIVQRVNYPPDANMPAAILETNRQIRLDLLAGLEKVVNNQDPRAIFHPGMQWTLEPNVLKLRYHSETPNLISKGDLLAMAAPAAQRLYTLEITLTAD